LAIGAGFAVLGLWGVLPFAGIEVLALVAAFACISRRAADHERITLTGGMLTVERFTGAFGGQLASEERFNAHWVRVDVDQGPAGRVVLSAGGRRSEVGTFVGHERRRRLAREMRIALRELR
jgi:uncharacterized membrane protein